MAQSLILSRLGKVLLHTNQYLEGNINENRFVINFKINNENKLYVLNMNTAQFIQSEIDLDVLLEKIPFGIEVFACDFINLLLGNIRIWELATIKMKQWYLSEDILDSPVSFLYGYFSEQIRPDLAEKVYDQLIS